MSESPFGYVKYLPHQSVLTIEDLRVMFENLYSFIVTDVPSSRERSLALTKLEEAAMWVNKGLSRA